MTKNHTIMDIVNTASSIRDSHCDRLGIPLRGRGLIALTSGLDVALTVMEESVGTFAGLSPEAAKRIVFYFKKESSKSEPLDLEIALWYSAWAEAIETLFIKKL